VQIKGQAPTQLKTGSTATCCANSALSISAILYARYSIAFYSKYHPKVNNPTSFFENIGAQIGFTYKLATHPTPFGMTFLKGWWTMDKEKQRLWLPLPSQVIKIGKLMTNPTHIIRTTMRKAVYILAYNISLSFGHIPPDYPILGPFLAMLKSFGPQETVAVHLLEKYETISVAPCTVDRAFTLELIEYRYGLSISDVDRVEKLISKVKALPVYLEDMVFQRLAEVDYM
jgi:hypothetical protein